MTAQECILALEARIPVIYDEIKFERISRVSIAAPQSPEIGRTKQTRLEAELVDSRGTILTTTSLFLIEPAFPEQWRFVADYIDTKYEVKEK